MLGKLGGSDIVGREAKIRILGGDRAGVIEMSLIEVAGDDLAKRLAESRQVGTGTEADFERATRSSRGVLGDFRGNPVAAGAMQPAPVGLRELYRVSSSANNCSSAPFDTLWWFLAAASMS